MAGRADRGVASFPFPCNGGRRTIRWTALAAALICAATGPWATRVQADPPTTNPAAANPADTAQDAKPAGSQAAPLLSLAYVPADAVGMFALRPHGFFGTNEMKVLDQFVNQQGRDFRLPVAVTQIDQLTMVLIAQNEDRPAPEPGGIRLIFDVNIVRTRNPVDWDKKRATFAYEMQAVEHSGKSYFKIPEQPNVCFWPIDAYNFVVADEWTLKRVIEQAPGDPAKLPWFNGWAKVADSSLAFGFESGFALKSIQKNNLPGADTLLKDTRGLLAALDTADGMRWRLMLDCPSDEMATKKIQATKAVIGLARSLSKPQPKPEDAKPAPLTAKDLTDKLLDKAEFIQDGPCAIVSMRADVDVAMAMQVIVRAAGSLFGDRMSSASNAFQAPPAPVVAPSAVPSGVMNSPAMVKRRQTSRQNLEKVAAALVKHNERTGALPASASRDPQGQPLLSWRVLVLPDLGYAELFQEFHLDEPWDSSHNIKLVEKMPREYGGPLNADAKPANGNTLVVAFVGPQACLAEQAAQSLAAVTDGMATTALVTETRRNIPWTKPEDLALDSTNRPSGRLGGVHPGGVAICTADGKSHFVAEADLAALIPALLTIAGGDTVEEVKLGKE